ncbi:HAMP domain-containing sensor histidine kinase [Salirhabdus salicampi]|uniref:HAMP domain-containing sensor histidine kinase n=1 Tax=Salirhabdus salicampi TaxID=476102 RepID=UPI0020C40E91|nr:HAMP domain-containing sensor histidine kinase [Salirhabdus salicampi]MCP8616394.1 HAMP domain-containing histidine kinase [Salirhabdus salicampi]
MATKWKNSLRTMLACAMLFSFGLSGLLILFTHGYYYAQKDYFHTSEFRYGIVDEFRRYIGIAETNLTLREAKEAITVTDEEILEHRYRYGNLTEQIHSIESQYEEKIQQAIEQDNQQVVDGLKADRDEKIEDITKNFESDQHVEAKIIKEKEQKLEEYYHQLPNVHPQNFGLYIFGKYKDSFHYYFEDTTSGKMYTNIADTKGSAKIFEMSLTIYPDYMVRHEISGSEELLNILHQSDRRLEGEISVPHSLSSSDPLMIQYENYSKEQKYYWGTVFLSMVSLILSLILFKKAKRSSAEMSQFNVRFRKLPIDVRIALLGLTSLVALLTGTIIEATRMSVNLSDVKEGIFFFVAVLILTLSLALTLLQTISLSESIKGRKPFHSEWKKSLVYRTYSILKNPFLKLVHLLREAFLDQTTGAQIIIVFGVVFGLGLAAVVSFVHPIFVLFYLILLASVGVPLSVLIIKKIGYFNRIVEKTNALVSGNMSQDLHITGKTALDKLAQNINVLKQGVKTSQNEQAKSERLKAELITNVSHDLRTPLTSIITYTELLKQQEDTSKDSDAYIEIIERKSKRLKVLIDDLFEVSKMASGNIELKKESVDLVQLLHQALAEYDDMISQSNLQFRVTNDDPPIYAVVDGQKLWRVFDNLIRNILKYSLDYSRVYLNLTTSNGYAIISFKNVSKYELNENSEELIERFKRGDTSRHTEGSGLGLAIAQTIVELHSGKFEIETDGDLFKVTIMLKI